jgi:hypothetical protein
MNVNVAIQIVVGLVFVWITLAMFTSQIQEWISSILNWRATMLENAIGNILGNPDLQKQFYEHPLVKGLYTNSGKRKPGGIPNDKFALVLYEMVMDAGKTTGEIKSSFDALQKGVENLKGQKGFEQVAGSLNTLLLGIEERADKTLDAATESRKRIESWFNDSMDRLSGAYKRRVQIVTIIVGIALAFLVNADMFAIIDKLWKDPLIRGALVAQASNFELPAQGEQQTPADTISEYTDQLNSFSLPLGWGEENIPATPSAWPPKILGILLSGIAAAQGAPFWFDLMRKLVRPAPASEGGSSK